MTGEPSPAPNSTMTAGWSDLGDVTVRERGRKVEGLKNRSVSKSNVC